MEQAGQASQGRGRASDRAGRASMGAGRASELAGRLSEPAVRASDPAGRLSEPAGRASELARRLSEPAVRASEQLPIKDESLRKFDWCLFRTLHYHFFNRMRDTNHPLSSFSSLIIKTIQLFKTMHNRSELKKNPLIRVCLRPTIVEGRS